VIEKWFSQSITSMLSSFVFAGCCAAQNAALAEQTCFHCWINPTPRQVTKQHQRMTKQRARTPRPPKHNVIAFEWVAEEVTSPNGIRSLRWKTKKVSRTTPAYCAKATPNRKGIQLCKVDEAFHLGSQHK
jgi:hypothetical protein